MANGRRGRKTPTNTRRRGKPVSVKIVLMNMGLLPAPSITRTRKRNNNLNQATSGRSKYPLKVPDSIRLVSQGEWSGAVGRRLEKQRIRERAKSGMPIQGWERIVEKSKKLSPEERREVGQELRKEILAIKKKIDDSKSQIKNITGRNLAANRQFLSRVRKQMALDMYLAQLQLHELANAMPNFEARKQFTPKTRALFIRRMMDQEKAAVTIQEVLLNENKLINSARKIIRKRHEE